MPDLDFTITGVEASARGMTPLILFDLQATNSQPEEQIRSALLQVQIQFECPMRTYTDREKEKLADLFGTPERWGQTLRNRLWTLAGTALPPFTGSTTARLAVPCTFDLNVSAAKYLYGIDDGDVPLLFLFSGTLFYDGPAGQLQVQRISHEKECRYRMPAARWRAMMDAHWPNSGWITLNRDLLDRLYQYRRATGATTWEQTIEHLLAQAEAHAAVRESMFDLLL